MTPDDNSEILNFTKKNSIVNDDLNSESEEIKIPKKRGRKPKQKNVEEIKVPKKRGRKPKNASTTNEPKIPKKRGRKPKDSVITTITNNETPIKKDNILHLKISNKDLDNNILTSDIFKYDPNINEPSPYDPKIDNLTLLNPDKEDINFLNNLNGKTKKNLIDNEKLNDEDNKNKNLKDFYNFQKFKEDEESDNLLDINMPIDNLNNETQENNRFDKCVNVNNSCMRKKKLIELWYILMNIIIEMNGLQVQI